MMRLALAMLFALLSMHVILGMAALLLQSAKKVTVAGGRLQHLDKCIVFLANHYILVNSSFCHLSQIAGQALNN